MKPHEMFPNGKTPLFYLGALAGDALDELAEIEQREIDVARLAECAFTVDHRDAQSDE